MFGEKVVPQPSGSSSLLPLLRGDQSCQVLRPVHLTLILMLYYVYLEVNFYNLTGLWFIKGKTIIVHADIEYDNLWLFEH